MQSLLLCSVYDNFIGAPSGLKWETVSESRCEELNKNGPWSWKRS